MGIRDAARNLGRSLKPGDDRALAAKLRAEEEAAARKAAAERKALIREMSDRDQRRTAAEIADSQARGRRGRRGPFAPPSKGVNP